MSSPVHSRRDALARAALAAGTFAAAGVVRPGLALAQTTDELLRDFLAEAIALEQIAALAYALAADDDAGTELKRTFLAFRDQEQAHANALRSAIDDIGFDAPEPPDTPTDNGVFDVDGISDDARTRLSDLLQGLQGLKGPDQRLDHLFELEKAQLSFYVEQGPDVESQDLATTSAEIAGCQAQHVYVLRRTVGDNPADAIVAAGEATDVTSS